MEDQTNVEIREATDSAREWRARTEEAMQIGIQSNGETGEIVSLEDIKIRYPNEWVLIAYSERDENLDIIRGEVLAHSPERKIIYDSLSLRKGKPAAIEYTGSIPEDIGFLM